MTVDHHPASDSHTITVRVPMTFRRFGGRKLVIVPELDEVPAPEPLPELDSPLIRALARAYRWRRQLEDGTRKSLGDIARSREDQLQLHHPYPPTQHIGAGHREGGSEGQQGHFLAAATARERHTAGLGSAAAALA